MDTITHGLAGALAGRAFFTGPEDRHAANLVILGSVFPDSDYLSSLFVRDELRLLQIHRGLTHSLVMLPLWALIIGLTAAAWRHDRRRALLVFAAGVGIVLHILMDVITSYGTMVWSPVSNARISWDTTFIVDFTFATIVVLPQLAAWVYSDRRQALRRGALLWVVLTAAAAAVVILIVSLRIAISPWTSPIYSAVIAVVLAAPAIRNRGFAWSRARFCQIGAAALALYMACCVVAHEAALAQTRAIARRSKLTVLRLAALPAPPSLWRWTGLVRTPEGILRIPMDLADARPPSSQFFANAANQFTEAALRAPRTDVFLWFSRFPWVTYHANGGKHVVEFRDLQFMRTSQESEAALPFTYRVLLDDDRRVLDASLLGP